MDVLINNAGIHYDDWQDVFDVEWSIIRGRSSLAMVRARPKADRPSACRCGCRGTV
ncbi:hypothetical protein [Lysobacter sp. TY2-98]|uniref:hypothetical protein n=1 Tax=Lysobacter sp. TY2-98 TaxID=2290922 RepID=UPI0013B3AB3B|nr:hypothetical protein [Lysobacter sp. TY2-98]